MTPIPTIAIVGRPNVGKSALFNRIARRQISLVFDRPGVTRDRLETDCLYDDKPFTLIDTGGIGLDDDSGFEDAVQHEVEIALEIADEVLIVVDGREGLQVLDEEVCRKLQKKQKKAHLVVNKIDQPKLENLVNDFAKLGFETLWPVSATHGIGVKDLLDHLSKNWQTREKLENLPPMPERLAIVGCPNVGKSSMINALFEEDRVIVSPTAGTTRDAVDMPFHFEGRDYLLIDTAGMRKESKVKDNLERVMTSRSAHAINRSHICLLVIDAMRGVGVQEQKISGLIVESKKPCVIVVNKWDLARQTLKDQPKDSESSLSSSDREFRKEYEEAVRRKLFGLPYAPIAFVSAMERRRMFELMKRIAKIAHSRSATFGTGQLNRILQKAYEKKSPPPKTGGKIFKIYYATQKPTGEDSVPKILAFVNDARLLSDDYRRYLETCIRKEYDFDGCPLVWELKNKQQKKSQKFKPKPQK